MSSVMARMRSADRLRKRLMLNVDRKYDGHHETDANNPKRTSGRRHIIGALGSAMALLSQAAQLTMGVALGPRSTTVGPPPGYARR